MTKQFLYEFLGTLLLVFIGCGSILLPINNKDNLQIVIGLCFGLAVALSIYLFARKSGSHINPAVSFLFFLNKDINLTKFKYYVLFQIAGAMLAIILLQFIFPNKTDWGSTLPKIGVWPSWGLEFGLSLLLFLAVYILRGKSIVTNAVILGGIVCLEAYFAGPFTGASMNPARSFAPMFFSGDLKLFWIYVSSQFAAAGVVFLLRNKLNFLHK
jgi:aquaporin NIP